LPPGTVLELDGFTLHVLPHDRIFGYERIRGLWRILHDLRPDVIQLLASIGPISLEAAVASRSIGAKLFTGCHQAASTFPLAQRASTLLDLERLACVVKRGIHGRLISLVTEKCYAVTSDCADIAVRFFGVQRRKVEVMHLCVEVGHFHPVESAQDGTARRALRTQLGFAEDDIVCVYSGKLTEEKNPLILANAVAALRERGLRYRTLVIGEGPQRDRLLQCNGCVVLPFLPYAELPPYYRAADIGVWPTNESTSMLDAAAAGLPLVVSDGIVYREHVEGNGLVMRMNDLDDLIRTLLALSEPEERARLGRAGTEKMRRDFSCESVARRRLADYYVARGRPSEHDRRTASTVISASR
jgi:glycosyltransferase involved in cell wall biosynthesis